MLMALAASAIQDKGTLRIRKLTAFIAPESCRSVAVQCWHLDFEQVSRGTMDCPM